MKRICVLVSGGIESALLVDEALRSADEVYPVYFRCGLTWEDAEEQALGHFLEKVKQEGLKPLSVLTLPVVDVYGAHWSVTGEEVPQTGTHGRDVLLPGRNLFFMSKASVFCSLNGIETIWFGPLNLNPFPDASPEFCEQMAKLATEALDHPIQIQAPFRKFSKPEILKKSQHLPLELTFSCIDPQDNQHCGHCHKCAERIRAFHRAGIPDPTPYLAPLRTHL